jgi:3-oxoacyl-[acyl-carrier protein] reductase
MSVVVHYAGHRDRADEVVARIVSAGGTATALGGDVANEVEMATLFDETERLYGGLDVVVHTAGVLMNSTLDQLNLDDLDHMIRVNLRGTFVVDQQAVRRVRSGGAIINFSTSVIKRALPTYGAYSATKGAIDAMTMVIAKELRGRDVTCNTVAPGPVATSMFLDGKSQGVIDAAGAASAMGRIGQPGDIAELVAFLAGPGRWVNGQVLYADGGLI